MTMSLATLPGNGSILRSTGEKTGLKCVLGESVAVKNAKVAGLILTWTTNPIMHSWFCNNHKLCHMLANYLYKFTDL